MQILPGQRSRHSWRRIEKVSRRRCVVWRGAALTLAARPDSISPYHVLRLENVKQAAPENYPALCFDPTPQCDRAIEQPNAGAFPGAACFHRFRPDIP
jgi:hypothetical protein